MARILVIDDDSDIRNTVRTLLERRGHSVVFAVCGLHGLAITEVFAFDAIVVDIFMPGMNGLDTVKVLHRLAPAVKVIVVSGYAFRNASAPAPDFLRMAVEFGAACCLHKPLRPRELIAAVDANLGFGRERRRA
jgi:CheY-like chemotaxis protein